MTTEIEKLWQSSQQDETEQLVNGSLLSQSTYICTDCGQAKDSPYKCEFCGHPGELNA